jgi:hypothetical protein
MNATATGTRIVDRLLLLETVSQSADGAVRVRVGGQQPPQVEFVRVVGAYSEGALGTALADVATDALTRHNAAAADIVAAAGVLPDPDVTDTPGARRRAMMAEAAVGIRVVVDSPAGLVTIELTGEHQVGAWIQLGGFRVLGVTDARLATEATAALGAARMELSRELAAVHRQVYRPESAGVWPGRG